jgi:hypothetical protein
MIIYYKISAHVGVCHLKVFHLHHTISKAIHGAKDTCYEDVHAQVQKHLSGMNFNQGYSSLITSKVSSDTVMCKTSTLRDYHSFRHINLVHFPFDDLSNVRYEIMSKQWLFSAIMSLLSGHTLSHQNLIPYWVWYTSHGEGQGFVTLMYSH